MRHDTSPMVVAFAARRQAVAQTWPQWRGPNRDGRTDVDAAGEVGGEGRRRCGRCRSASATRRRSSPTAASTCSRAKDDKETAVGARSRKRQDAVVAARRRALHHELRRRSRTARGRSRRRMLHGGRALHARHHRRAVGARRRHRQGRRGARRSKRSSPSPRPTSARRCRRWSRATRSIAHVGGPGKGALRAFDLATGRCEVELDRRRARLRLAGRPHGRRHATDRHRDRAAHRRRSTSRPARRCGRCRSRRPTCRTSSRRSSTRTPSSCRGSRRARSQSGRRSRARRGPPRSVWDNADVPMYMSSPVLNRRHAVRVLAAATGASSSPSMRGRARRLWTSPPRQGENAAIVGAGDQLAILTDDGQLTMAKATPDSLDARVEDRSGVEPDVGPSGRPRQSPPRQGRADAGSAADRVRRAISRVRGEGQGEGCKLPARVPA